MLGLNVRASQPFPAQVTALRGSTVLARFGDVWYFATVQDVRGSYEVEVLWESEYSRSIVAIQDLQPIVDPERCIAAIQPTAAVLARFGADAWRPGRVKACVATMMSIRGHFGSRHTVRNNHFAW